LLKSLRDLHAQEHILFPYNFQWVYSVIILYYKL
jgi:hypothetical protein